MVLRTNSKDGSPFWGCRRFPKCRGTKDVGEEAHDSPIQVKVLWNDATLDRAGWQCRYTTAGGSLRSSPALRTISREVNQCWIARTRNTHIAPESVRRVTGAIRKLIQRGSNPPIHPHAERELLDSLGLGEDVRPSELPGDISVRLEPDAFQDLRGIGMLPGPDSERDDEVRLESAHERHFIDNWVPQNLGPYAARWFVPQAPLDALTSTLSGHSPSGRRVDFLVSPPFTTTFVIEIDGPQHQGSSEPDAERDRMLAQVGIDVIRIPTSEIELGYGPNLERVKAMWPGSSQVPDERTANAILMPASVHRLVIALLDAVEAGFLSGQRWTVEVAGEPVLSAFVIWPYVRLFAAMGRLWGPSVMPAEILLKTRDGCTKFETSTSTPPAPCESPDSTTDLTIRLEPHLTAFDKLARSKGETPEIVVRSAHLPVVVGDDLFEPAERSRIEGVDDDEIELALTEVLQCVFAKENFREGQLDAVLEILAGRDCAVLLPTGGGKSLIYQMAGMCQPGRTIVVDPLIALIEDQQRGLAEHGIDKVVGLSSYQVAQGRLEPLLKQVTSGEALFVFIAPERFQHRRFRESIKSLTQATSINLAVIDEAHCVSEWGHNFRTSYLTLGKVLREVCKDNSGFSPPLLALTGTASRAVLKDVLTQLAISEESEHAIIRPASFDRPELEMETLQSNPDDAAAVLTGNLNALPSRFGVPQSDFFRARAHDTYSGLIFCPFVNDQYGILELQQITSRVIGFVPAIYSGKAPKGLGQSGASKWEQQKREFADSFMDNSIPLMVSTRAFGMGIDKPNIRYVFHYGMPGSIESYYQEIGRAGRDRNDAYCLLIWNEQDRSRSDRLTITDGNLEDVRREHETIDWDDRDSITRQLFLLLDTFKGVDAELEEVVSLLRDPEISESLGRRKNVELARGRDSESDRRERALYRLMVLGVVEDYLKEAKFVVYLANASSASVAEKLSAFVQRNDPGSQRPGVNAFIAQAGSMRLEEAILAGARELIEFTYDVIVESRRRSLREMYVATRDASAGGSPLRDRVLDYLTRGDISPELEGALEAREFDYGTWERTLARFQGIEDARELRGSSARLLASSPFNPGLLYARAYSELIHPEGDLQDFAANLEASLSSARDRYGVPEADLEKFAARLLNKLESESFVGLSLAVDIADRIGLAADAIARIENSALQSAGGDLGVRVVALSKVMNRLSEEVNAAIGDMTNGE